MELFQQLSIQKFRADMLTQLDQCARRFRNI